MKSFYLSLVVCMLSALPCTAQPWVEEKAEHILKHWLWTMDAYGCHEGDPVTQFQLTQSSVNINIEKISRAAYTSQVMTDPVTGEIFAIMNGNSIMSYESRQIIKNGGLFAGWRYDISSPTLMQWVRRPSHPNQYMIISSSVGKGSEDKTRSAELLVAILDRTGDEGRGEIISNVKIPHPYPFLGGLDITRDCAETGYWVATRDSMANLVCYHINSAGMFSTKPVINPADDLPIRTDSVEAYPFPGSIVKFSPNGRYVCVFRADSGASSAYTSVARYPWIYPFDKSTGLIDFERGIRLETGEPEHTMRTVRGKVPAFSPDGTKFYLPLSWWPFDSTRKNWELLQWDLSTFDSAAINNSRTVLGPGERIPRVGDVASLAGINLLGDGKLYVFGYVRASTDRPGRLGPYSPDCMFPSISRVNLPNARGSACDFRLDVQRVALPDELDIRRYNRHALQHLPDFYLNPSRGVHLRDFQLTGSADTVCTGTVVELSTDVDPSVQLRWEPSSLFVGQQNRRTVSAAFTSSRWVWVRGTSADGCEGLVDSIFVAVVAPPSPRSYDTTVCAGTAIEFNAPPETEWLVWDTPWGQSSTPTLSFVADTSALITLRYGVAHGCEGRVSYRVRANKLSMEILTSAPRLCVGDSVVLESSIAQTYLWEPSEGLSSTTARAVVARPTRTTTYRVKGVSLGCEGMDSVTVTVVSSEASAGADVQLCPGESTTLSGSGGESVEWRRVGSPEILSTERKLSVSPVQTQRYELRTTRGGCEARDTVEVRVGGSLEVAATGPAGVCVGEVIELSATGAEEYDWYDSAGVLVHRGATKQETALASRRYRIEGRRGDCRGSAEVGYEVYPLPSASVSTLSGCVGDPVELRASGAAVYRWSVAGEEVSRDSVYRPEAPQPGTYTVGLRIESADGCSADTTVSYSVSGPQEVSVRAGTVRVAPGDRTAIPLELQHGGALAGTSAEVRVRYDRRLFLFDSVTGTPTLKSKNVEDMKEEIVLEWPLSGTVSSVGELRGTAMMTHIPSTPVDVEITLPGSCVSTVTEGGLYELSEICYPFSVRLFAPLELRVAVSSLGVQAAIAGGLGDHWHVVVTDAVGRVVSESHRHRGSGEVLVVDLPLGGSGVYFLRVVSERGMAATAGVSVVR